MRMIFGFLVAVGCFALAGCLGPHGSLCEEAAQCGGGGDFEIEACIAELDAEAEIADIYDCGDAYDDWIDCLDEFGMCEGDKLDGPCGSQKDSLKSCVDARERGKAKID